MRKPIFIGEKSYKYKKDVLLHYKTILNSYNFGQSLNDADFNDLLDLIFQHREDSIEKNQNNESTRTPSSYVLNPAPFAKEQVDTEPMIQERYIKCPISKTQVIDYENANIIRHRCLSCRSNDY